MLSIIEHDNSNSKHCRQRIPLFVSYWGPTQSKIRASCAVMFKIGALLLVRDTDPPLAGQTKAGANVCKRCLVGIRGRRADDHCAVGYGCGSGAPECEVALTSCRVAQWLAEEGGGVADQIPAELNGGVVRGEADLANRGLPLTEVPSFLEDHLDLIVALIYTINR